MDCKYKLPCGLCDKFGRKCEMESTPINTNWPDTVTTNPILTPPYIAKRNENTNATLGGINNTVTTAHNDLK